MLSAGSPIRISYGSYGRPRASRSLTYSRWNSRLMRGKSARARSSSSLSDFSSSSGSAGGAAPSARWTTAVAVGAMTGVARAWAGVIWTTVVLVGPAVGPGDAGRAADGTAAGDPPSCAASAAVIAAWGRASVIGPASRRVGWTWGAAPARAGLAMPPKTGLPTTAVAGSRWTGGEAEGGGRGGVGRSTAAAPRPGAARARGAGGGAPGDPAP